MRFVDAALVVTPDGMIGPARVRWQDAWITAIEPLAIAPDRILVPGFVDLQVNGIDDVDVATADGNDWHRMDEQLLAQGVTTWCPTLVTMPLPHYARPLARIGAAMRRSPVPGSPRPTIAGVHLEGPFLGAAPGAHPRHLIAEIDLEWLAALPAHTALVTLGAEQAAAVEATRVLTRAGRLVSIGHSRATDEQFDSVVAAGARLTTHLFNGMSGVHHRDPGVATWALTNPHVCASLIADGVHVHPRVLRLAFEVLGPDRSVLVTDAVAWRAGRAGAIRLEVSDGAPRLPDGTLAGSTLTMDRALRVCTQAGVPLEHAVRAASTTPARLLGLHDRGRVQVGARADLVLLTPDFEVEHVWVGGDAV